MAYNVVFVDSYTDPPKDAEYILREMEDCTVILEKYYQEDETSEIIAEFPIGSLFEEKMDETIEKARKAMHSRKRLYVEKPDWWWASEHLSQCFPMLH